jgi:hypothetical protein
MNLDTEYRTPGVHTHDETHNPVGLWRRQPPRRLTTRACPHCRRRGKLSLAIWDHWVPTGDAALKKLVDAWAEKNKVEVQLDFLTSIGEKINITMAAEAQAKTGHDVYAFDMWTVHEFADSLVPVDDVMKTINTARSGMPMNTSAWATVRGALCPWPGVRLRWRHAAASACWNNTPALTCRSGCGSGSTDARQTWGATFGAFGANLLDSKGNITVDSDTVREAMEYCKRLIPFLPPDTVQYDDASNNRPLISGKRHWSGTRPRPGQ